MRSPLSFSLLAAAALALAPSERLAAQGVPPTQPAYAADSTAVIEVIKTVLEAMRVRDTVELRRRLHPSMPMRVMMWRGNDPIISSDSASGWITGVGTAPATMVLDERIGAPSTIQVDGNLANVWTYYEFRRTEEFSHCGVDQFTLGRTDTGWKVLFLSYSVRRTGCEPHLTTLPRQRALRELISAERAFAYYADTANISAAFVWALRDDAITLDADGVKQMRPMYQARRPGPALLLWEPSWAGVSEDGNFGVTTGPWTWRPARDSSVKARGQFLTIWRKGPDRWQVALDLGVTGDSTAQLLGSVREMPVGVAGRARLGDVLDTDRDRIKGNGWLRALRDHSAPDVRVLREGEVMAEGREALTGSASVRFTPLGGTVASSGDLAGTWGTWRDGNTRGSYVRIWKHTAEGWRVVVDRMGE